MNDALVREAEALGINVSMYYLLPPNRREDALRRDVARAKQKGRD